MVLGRIGRATLKIVLDNPALRLTAVNDVLPADNLAYLLKFDTVYGRWTGDVTALDGRLNVDGIDYPVLSEREPAKLPWSQWVSTSCSSAQASLQSGTISSSTSKLGAFCYSVGSCEER